MPALPDLVCPGLDVLFVGTAVGKRSACTGHYYADPRNSFYRDLKEAGFTDRLLNPAEDRELLHYGIGLTDLAKRIVCSDDAGLDDADFDRGRLARVIRNNKPRVVCFNGKNAYHAWSGSRRFNWGLRDALTIEGVPLFVVPSTSSRVPAGRRFQGRTRREWFRVLKDWLRHVVSCAHPAYDRFIAIDWSGAKRESDQWRGIWWCVAEAHRGKLQVHELAHGKTREEVVDWLHCELQAGVPTLVGIDFPFSFPKGFVASQGASEESWDDVLKSLVHYSDSSGNSPECLRKAEISLQLPRTRRTPRRT